MCSGCCWQSVTSLHPDPRQSFHFILHSYTTAKEGEESQQWWPPVVFKRGSLFGNVCGLCPFQMCLTKVVGWIYSTFAGTVLIAVVRKSAFKCSTSPLLALVSIVEPQYLFFALKQGLLPRLAGARLYWNCNLAMWFTFFYILHEHSLLPVKSVASAHATILASKTTFQQQLFILY